MDTFFEECADGDTNEPNDTTEDFQPLPHQPLTLGEVRQAVMGAQPHKAPGQDSIPAIVSRELWPVVGQYIFHLFEASLRASHVPQPWKVAKIIPARETRQSRLHTTPSCIKDFM